MTKESIDYEFYCENEYFDESDQEYLLRKIIYDEYLEKYNECQNVNQKDDMLTEAILKVYPEVLEEYPLVRHLPQKTKKVALEETNTEKKGDLKAINWLKNGRTAMGIGMNKVKHIIEKYKYRSKQEVKMKNETNDIEK